jgi:hypothetical protein
MFKNKKMQMSPEEPESLDSLFEDTTIYDEYIYLKYFWLGIFAVIRFFFICVYITISCGLACILPTRYYQTVIPFFCNCITWTAGFYSIKIKNKQNFNKNSIVVYNHSCIFDGFFIVGKIFPCSITIRSERNGMIPGIATFSDGLVFKKQSGGTEMIIDHFNSGKRTLMIAPEGTITNGTGLLPFKLGAFRPLVPIQPVVLFYPNRVSVSWGNISLFWNMFNILTQIVNNAVIEVLPCVYPKHGETPEEFCERVRNSMANKVRSFRSVYF